MIDSRKLAVAGLILAGALADVPVANAQTRTAMPAASANRSLAPPSTDAVFQRWDRDKNKSLNIEEFKAGWEEMQVSMVLRKLHSNFVVMDSDKSGGLEAAEYANLELVRKAGKSAPMMAFYDSDKNGKLDFKEYSLMVTAMMKTNPMSP